MELAPEEVVEDDPGRVVETAPELVLIEEDCAPVVETPPEPALVDEVLALAEPEAVLVDARLTSNAATSPVLPGVDENEPPSFFG